MEEWQRVLWSDESPFELFHPTSAQNDRVWSTDNSKIPPIETVKNRPKVIVWAIMSYRAVSELHFVHILTPDLNPIENLCSILQERLNELESPTNLDQLSERLRIAWKGIPPSTLENLVAGMPKRIEICLALNGEFIGK